MKLPVPSLQLPLLFDVEAMVAEVDALAHAWRADASAGAGIDVIDLASWGGVAHGSGRPAPTSALAASPYLRQVLGSIGGILGGARLVRIAAAADLPAQVDVDRYWQERARLYVPIVAVPPMHLDSGGVGSELAAGECWIVDGWQPQRIEARGATTVHLVAATIGGARFWALAASGRRPDAGSPPWTPQRIVPATPTASPALEFECDGDDAVMSPWEMREHVAFLLRDADAHPSLPRIRDLLSRLDRGWQATWAARGPDAADTRYRNLLDQSWGLLRQAGVEDVRLRSGVGLAEGLRRLVFGQAVPGADGRSATRALPAGVAVEPAAAGTAGGNARDLRFDRPVFIVSPPRSGSTLLFEALAASPGLYTVGGESHQVIELIPGLGVMERADRSNRLGADDATPAVVARLRARFDAALRDARAAEPPKEGRIRMLEKTPKNALRIPFLAAAFPEAHFVYLRRDPAEVLGSMLDGWASGRFQTYARLPGWPGPGWSFLLIPGWERMAGADIAHVVGEQWRVSTRHILDGLDRIPDDRRTVVDYHRLVDAPDVVLADLRRWAGLEGATTSPGVLPPSRSTLTPPAPGKWRRHADRILPILAANSALIERMHAL